MIDVLLPILMIYVHSNEPQLFLILDVQMAGDATAAGRCTEYHQTNRGESAGGSR